MTWPELVFMISALFLRFAPQEQLLLSYLKEDNNGWQIRILSQKCLFYLPPRPLKDRGDMGDLLEEYRLKTGVEVGVKEGQFSREGWQFS